MRRKLTSLQISWSPTTAIKRGTDGEYSPASAPQKGLRRVRTGTAKLGSQFGRKAGIVGGWLAGARSMEGGTPCGPSLPQPIPPGRQGRTGAPLRAARRRQRPWHHTCQPDQLLPAPGHGPRPTEQPGPARVGRTRGAAPPTRLPGPVRDPCASTAASRPHPRLGLSCTSKPPLPGLPPSSPTTDGLHLPSIAMMCSPWTAPTGWRGRRARVRAEEAPGQPASGAGRG